MNLITTNTHQCIPAAFAMVMDWTLEETIGYLGHDGLDKVFENMPEPICFRSFHPQEFVDILLEDGYNATMIELNPHLKYGDKLIDHTDFLGEERFYKSLLYGNGIIFGEVNGIGHAVAWNSQEHAIYDPRGHVFGLDQFDQYQFKPRQFFLIR